MSVTSAGAVTASDAAVIERAFYWIRVRRFMLVGCGLAALGAFAGMFVLSPGADPEGAAFVAFTLCGLALGLTPLVAAGLAYFQMRALGRPAAAGVLGSLLMPWAVPLILACLGEQRVSRQAVRQAQRRIAISGTVLTVRTGTFRRVRLALDSLRLLAVWIPESTAWRGLWSTSEHSSMFLDLMEDDGYAGATKVLAKPLDLMPEVVNGRRYTERDRRDALSLIEVLMEDDEGHYVTLDVTQIDLSGCDLFGVLGKCRARRRERLDAWVASEPTVDLRGRLWGSVQISLAGFRKGKRLTPWSDVRQVYTEKSGSSATFYVLPKGVSSGFLSFGKSRYGLSIRASDARRYGAWCHLFARLANASIPEAPEGAAAGGAELSDLMAGKTLCTACNTIHSTTEEAVSCCGATTVGFIAATRGASCSKCGAHFSDGAVSTEDTLEQTVRAKGLGCPSCGTLFCYGCAPKDGSKGFDATCTCGTTLSIRV
jgi:hypothetical protein